MASKLGWYACARLTWREQEHKSKAQALREEQEKANRRRALEARRARIEAQQRRLKQEVRAKGWGPRSAAIKLHPTPPHPQAKQEEELADKRARQLEEEERARQRAEAAIAKMEEEERRLIERLKRTQTKQRSAYHKLEEVLVKDVGQEAGE